MENKKIAIIGLGLIGGSLAKALKEKMNIKEIYAVNRSKNSIDKAKEENIIKDGFQQLNNTIYTCDIIFICTSISKTFDYINELKDNINENTIITDVGSTKSEIAHFVDGLDTKINFVGGHPMAGSEASGYSSSYSHLFENAFYILTPGKYAKNESINILNNIITELGAIPIIIDPSKHDNITGSISHIPHIVASALVNLVNKNDQDGLMKELAVGGFKDITRIASSNPEIWESIVISNKVAVKKILLDYIKILNKFIEFIDKNDITEINNFFRTAKEFRDSFADSRKNPLYPAFDIAIDVIDKPGVIGEITSLLGKENINIKNLYVANSREYEEGCIKITLSDHKSLDLSIELLAKNGYKVLYKSQKIN